MRKAYLFIVYCLLSIVYNAWAIASVSSEALLKSPEQYDGKVVTYEGEVIGDVMVRGNIAWINVGDQTSTIGVFCPKELAGEIEHSGGYGVSGDIISVQGVFHYACPEHGGDTDIHAQKISVIQKGKRLSYPLDQRRVKLGIILSATAFALAILHLIIRRFR